jgi:diaminopimelate decarboxylase
MGQADWNVDFHQLVQRFGSPVYLYDEAKIKRMVNNFKMINYKPTNIYFATMSNNTPGVLRLLRTLGIKLFVNTPKHLLIGLGAGFSPSEIVFTSTNLSSMDMKYAIASGVALNVDSLGQLEQYGRLNPGGCVGLRVNLDTLSHFPESHSGVYIGPKSRIGIFESELDKAFAIAKKNNLKLVGVHVYLGTNIQEHDIFLEGAEEIFRIAHRFPDLRYIDLGGGFPVKVHSNEPDFDYKQFGDAISARMERFSEEVGRSIELAFEPGRALLSDTAAFITTATDIKQRKEQNYIGVDSSIDIFPRPLYYDVSTEAYHPVFIVGKHQIVTNKSVNVCGSTTYSRDYLARDRYLPEVKVGDILVFENAGAYCCSAYSDFLRRLRPAELLLNSAGKINVLREAETIILPEALCEACATTG